MENNELDNFFRQNAHKMDEAPTDALWQRIEQQMEAKPAKTGRINISGKLFILLATVTVTTVAITLWALSKENPLAQPAPTVITPETTVSNTKKVTETDTIKKKPTIKTTAVKKQAAIAITPKKVAPKEEIVDNFIADSPDEPTAKPEPTVQQKVIKTTTVYNPKRTIVTINEAVNQHVYDSIVATNIDKYKDKVGIPLIIKGGGKETFRYVIPEKDIPEPQRDSIIIPKNNLAATAVIKTNKDSFSTEPETVQLEPYFDSVSKQYYVRYAIKPDLTPLKKAAKNDNKIYKSDELTAQVEFPGGIEALNTYIAKNFRVPEINKMMSLKIYTSFIVEKDGSISDIQIVKDPGYGLGEEAVRFLKNLTVKWKPAEINNEVVRTRLSLPLTINTY